MERKENISRLLKEYYSILISRKKISLLKDEIELLHSDLELLSRRVDDEYLDIEELEKLSIQNIFSRVLRKGQEQLEKENQEYLMAVLEYMDALKIVKLLEYELEVLESKVEKEKFIKKDLDRNLLEVEESFWKSESIYLAEYVKVTKELKNLTKMKVEVEEAYEMLLLLREAFLEMIKSLNLAEQYDNWGVFYAERKSGRITKQNYLDHAQIKAIEIKQILKFLKKELVDVSEIKEILKKSEIPMRNFNLNYYNGLITDWINDINLTNTLSISMNGSKSINKLTHEFEYLTKNIVEEYLRKDSYRIELIDRLSQ